jgi:hypothetical protein
MVNTGNTNLQVTSLSVTSGVNTNVAVLTCKAGFTSDADDAVAASFTTGGVAPGHKVVCTGTFTFLQTLLDTDIASKVFSASAAASVAGTVSASISSSAAAADNSYAATTSVAIVAAPVLDFTVNAAACSKPTIILAGATSKLGCMQCCDVCKGALHAWRVVAWLTCVNCGRVTPNLGA